MFSVIIPTHNEEKRVFDTLARLTHFLQQNYPRKFEIIVVDDGTDSTQRIVRFFARKPANRVRLAHFGRRLGKGGALMQGIRLARGGHCICYDADAAVPPEEIPKMLDALVRFDVVIGSRKAERAVIVGRIPLRRRFASRAFNTLVTLLFRLGVRDTQCGFKGFGRKKILRILPRIRSRGFEWDVELLVCARHAGLTLHELPVEWHHKKEGKVVLRDTLHMLQGVIRLKRDISNI
ncbi:MAG: glycosyltransferase [Candidatus Micrarchaeota archaeon]